MNSNLLYFADESCIDSNYPIYGIGLLQLRENQIKRFNSFFEGLKKRYGIQGEVKWKKIQNSRGQVLFCVELLKAILKANVKFSIIVVQKSTFNKWKSSKEEGFYTTYSLLLKYFIESKENAQIYIDNRNDSYKKQDEKLHIITNHMLANTGGTKPIRSLEKHNSKLFPALQAVDILTGPIVFGSNQYFKDLNMSNRKKEVISGFANLLGLDALGYDTYPDKYFNIWHFPKEFRATPETKRINLNYRATIPELV